MKKLDPKLLARLAERDDANEVLAEALGVCPTCGQAWPPQSNGALKAPRRGSRKDAVIEYLTKTDTAYGNQSRCARTLKITLPYVNKIWVDYRVKHGGGVATPKAGMRAVQAWLRENPDKTQSECARELGVTRSYVSQVAQRGDAPQGEADE